MMTHEARAQQTLLRRGYMIETYQQDVYPIEVSHRDKHERGRFWTITSALHCLTVNGRIY